MKLKACSVTLFVYLVLMDPIQCEPRPTRKSQEPTEVTSSERKNYTIDPAALKANLASFGGFLEGSGASEMFFWFFPSESKKETDPVIVWLQGDVGTSSLKGLFENNGPFYVKQNKGTQSRKSYWSKSNNVLYLDTAVGTGFSNYNRTNKVPENMNELVSNLFNALINFFNEFNTYVNNDLYLAGDGFACQILTKLAKKIDQFRNLRLKGLILENGFCDPFNAIPVANYLFSLRVFDTFRHVNLLQVEKQILEMMRNNKYEEAFDKYDTYIKGLLTPYKTLFNNYTHYESTLHLLHDKEYRHQGNFSNYVMKDGIKRTLGIPKELPYHNGKIVLKKLRRELMKSSITELGQLMNKYRVLMYYGQMNPEISPKGAFLTASSIKWCGGKFFSDLYVPWFVDTNLAGYIANVNTGDCMESFTWALVRGAGKNVAGDKPKEISDLIYKFTSQTF